MRHIYVGKHYVGDEEIYNVYGRGPTFSGASESIRKVLPYLVHKDCNANILEIGAGMF